MQDSLRDLSTVQSQIPGFRTLKDSEIVKCGSFSLPTCNRTGKFAQFPP